MSAAAFAAVMLMTCTPASAGGTADNGAQNATIGQSLGDQPTSPMTPTPAPAPPVSASDTPQVDKQVPQDGTASGDIVVTARRRTPGDPLAAVNEESFAATQAVDRAVVGPVATAFERTVPTPIRSGLRNFFINLHEPIVFVNFLLQLKIGKAAETAARFAINTTVGVGGFIDIAKRKPINLPRRKNGFADTLGFYGVGPGPFLFLPLVGPTTVRDLLGGGIDRVMMPFYLGKPFSQPVFNAATGGIHMLDRRAEFDDQLTKLRAEHNPYAATRDYYLWRRQAEIDGLHGRKDAPFGSEKGKSAISAPAAASPPAKSSPPPIG